MVHKPQGINNHSTDIMQIKIQEFIANNGS